MNRQLTVYGLLGLALFGTIWWFRRPVVSTEIATPGPHASSPLPSSFSPLTDPTSVAPQERGPATQAIPAEPPIIDEWAAYEASTAEELIAERDQLRASLNAECRPLLWTQVRRGRAELIAEPGEFSYESRPEDRTELHGILNDQERGVFRASLSRADYPDLYEVKDRIDRLSNLIASKPKAPR